MIDERKMSKQPQPALTASAIGPFPTVIQISRTARHWQFTQHHCTALHIGRVRTICHGRPRILTTRARTKQIDIAKYLRLNLFKDRNGKHFTSEYRLSYQRYK